MFHIFEQLKPGMLQRFIELGKTYFVAQQYHYLQDHFAGEKKINLLLTSYGDSEIARAHLGAIKDHPYACIIDLKNEKHHRKICEMLGPGSKYQLFWAAVAQEDCQMAMTRKKRRMILLFYVVSWL